MWSWKWFNRFFISCHLCKWHWFECLDPRWLPGHVTGGRGHVIRKLLAMSITYVPSLKLIGLMVLAWQAHLGGRRKIIIIIIINIAASSDDRVSRQFWSTCWHGWKELSESLKNFGGNVVLHCSIRLRIFNENLRSKVNWKFRKIFWSLVIPVYWKSDL